MTDAFIPAALTAKIDAWAGIIRPYAEKDGQGTAFEAAVSQLKTFTTQRARAVETFLATGR